MQPLPKFLRTEYYEEDTEMDEEAYDTEEITENETDAEDLEMTE